MCSGSNAENSALVLFTPSLSNFIFWLHPHYVRHILSVFFSLLTFLNFFMIMCKKTKFKNPKGLSQRVAYFYPTGVTRLHTSSPSPPRARLRAAARARVGAAAARAALAGRGLL